MSKMAVTLDTKKFSCMRVHGQDKGSPNLYQPSPRNGHYASSIGDNVFLFFGHTEHIRDEWRELSYQVEIYDPYSETWVQRQTTGTPPPGLYSGASTSRNNQFYIYGGYGVSRFNGALSLFDATTMKWKLLTSDTEPMKKSRAGMVLIGQNKLVLFGGYGIPVTPTQPGAASFVKNSSFSDGRGWSNELHMYNINNGMWSCPQMAGPRPPPCVDFSFISVNDYRAVVFGGYQAECGHFVNDLYIIDFLTMHWTKVEQGAGETWPEARSYPAACCFDYGGEHPQILISGGLNNDGVVLRDAWLFDVSIRKWKKLTLPDNVQPRFDHSLSVVTLTHGLIEVIMFGGCPERPENGDLPKKSETMILRFESIQHPLPSGGPSTREWMLVDVATNNQRGTSERLREKMMKIATKTKEMVSRQEYLTDTNNTSTTDRAEVESLREVIQALQEEKRVLEHRVEEANTQTQEAEATVHYLRQTVDDAQKRAEDTEQRANIRIQEAERRLVDTEAHVVDLTQRLQEATLRVTDAERRDQQLHATVEDELAPFRLYFQDPLPASRKVGSGCYGTVYAIEVDGIQCIAKRVQDILLGEGGQEDVGGQQRRAIQRKFRQECILLSKIRHPNIVQFMGVRYGRDMYDLTLVMERLPMDLQKCLERCQADNFFIPLSIRLSILCDVTYGLLHLHNRPQPILHRDLTAGNILLTSNLRAKIADLGVSRIVEASWSQKLSTLPGTIAYMPPEALTDEPEYNLKLDVFSFGVLALFVSLQEFPVFSWAHVPDEIARKGERELYKRRKWITKIGERHLLYPSIHQCLQDNSDSRPSTAKLNTMMKQLSTQFPHRLQDINKMLAELSKLGMSEIVSP